MSDKKVFGTLLKALLIFGAIGLEVLITWNLIVIQLLTPYGAFVKGYWFIYWPYLFVWIIQLIAWTYAMYLLISGKVFKEVRQWVRKHTEQ